MNKDWTTARPDTRPTAPDRPRWPIAVGFAVVLAMAAGMVAGTDPADATRVGTCEKRAIETP